MHTIQNSASQGPRDKSLKLTHIRTEEFGRFVVERVIRIGFVKQINEAVNDRIDIENGLPILAQNIQAHFSLQINVGVVYFCVAFHLWRRVRVMRGDGESKVVRRSFPVATVGGNRNLKRSQVISVWKVNCSDLSTVKFSNVCAMIRL